MRFCLQDLQYLHGPFLEDGGGVHPIEGEGGGIRRARGPRGEIIVVVVVIVAIIIITTIDAIVIAIIVVDGGNRGKRGSVPVNHVVVARRVSEAEVEELAPVQLRGPSLAYRKNALQR